MSPRTAWLIALVILSYPRVSWAHGVQIEINSTAIAVQATYDNGQPLRDAQVQVYAPGEPETPWLKGKTDHKGHFSFVPDASQPGAWEVTVRQAGHGGTTIVTVGKTAPGTAALGQSAELSPVQYWLSVGAIVWGLIGTALFFARGKR
jgi:nickel transport protein